MHLREVSALCLVFLVILAISLSQGIHARELPDRPAGKAIPGPARSFDLDVTNNHDVGQLHIHVNNWGMFGSYPSSNWPISSAPSAEWPAGSGINHLYGAGLWVGAKKNGIPHVSTSVFQREFRPTEDPADLLYETYEGAPGGNRIPFPDADDDGDGIIDEDFLDARDNDGDGLIDEDFAAVSPQMFSCWFTDDQPLASESYPEHEPLHILVRQESYQWDDERFDDFVGIRFIITNTGSALLEDVYLGFHADGDIGPRDGTAPYWLDDAAGSWRGVRCTDLGPVYLNMGYMFDADGDGGTTPGYIGAMLLGHTTDPLGLEAPRHVELNAFRTFSGPQPYENGGDPTNDFQRYEVLAQQRFDRNTCAPSDYRILISAGPFPELAPGETVVVYFALVAGEGISGLLENAASAQRLFDGIWYDLDGDPETGVAGRESPVYGPAQDVYIDECRIDVEQPVDLLPGAMAWVNNDCTREELFKSECLYSTADTLIYKTGVGGMERQIHWLLEPPEPMLDVLDIKPGSCPNPFNAKWLEAQDDAKPKKGGVLPVAILGKADFDVHDIDVSTVRLEGVAPRAKGRVYEDVSRPVEDKTGCECTDEGPDGYCDLVLKFGTQDIGAALSAMGSAVPGEERILVLTGELEDGTAFAAADCIVFVGKPPKPDRPEPPAVKPDVVRISPNPFNPATRITFTLPEPQHVRLSVYDVAGRLLSVLADGVLDAGEHTVGWNAGGASSGIYFVRLEAGSLSTTSKMILLR